MMLFQTLLSPGTSNVLVIDQSNIIAGIFKVLFILSVFFYIIFAIVVIRQVQIMKNTLITPVSPLILLASIAHLLFAVGILLMFLAIL